MWRAAVSTIGAASQRVARRIEVKGLVPLLAAGFPYERYLQDTRRLAELLQPG